MSDERELCGRKSETEADRVLRERESTSKKNVLAITQLDHYLLLHKYDVVEKVKLMVCAERRVLD